MFGFSTYRQRFEMLFDIRWRFNFNYVHVFASSSLLFSLGLTAKPELLIESGAIRLNFFFWFGKKEKRSFIADKNIENHSIGTVFFKCLRVEKKNNSVGKKVGRHFLWFKRLGQKSMKSGPIHSTCFTGLAKCVRRSLVLTFGFSWIINVHLTTILIYLTDVRIGNVWSLSIRSTTVFFYF